MICAGAIQVSENKRRNPKQGRAKATVEAILEASFQILETEGLSRLTTNLAAERAGVSIGTLYQYFADRDEILAELGQRQAGDVRERIAAIVSESPERSSVRAIVQALTSGMTGSPATRIILSDALFRVRGEGVLSTHHLAFLDSIGLQFYDQQGIGLCADTRGHMPVTGSGGGAGAGSQYDGARGRAGLADGELSGSIGDAGTAAGEKLTGARLARNCNSIRPVLD